MTIASETIEPSFIPTFRQKLNPLWWLMNGDSFDAPAENNGAPYLPEISDPTTRAFYWWMRNPFANFVGFVIGVEDKSRTIYGVTPFNEATAWDHGAHGWKWACTQTAPSLGWLAAFLATCFIIWCGGSWWLFPVAVFTIFRGAGVLPFLSYSGSWILFYVGWRYSGGFGVKINRGHALAPTP